MATSEKQDKEEYFPIGSTVQCVTCLGETIEGIVATFDRATKLLALKSYRPAPGSTKKSRVQHLQIINVNLVQQVNIVQEAPPASSQQVVVPNFNYTKISKRAVEEALRKRRSICADSVAPEGQKLFITIRKTIEDVQWKDGDQILVLSAVIVSPPYKSENVEICFNDEEQRHRHHQQNQSVSRAQAQRAADHVKKIIDQFWSKQSDDTSCSSLSLGNINENNNNNSNNGNNNNSNDTRRRNSSEPPESLDSKRSSSPAPP